MPFQAQQIVKRSAKSAQTLISAGHHGIARLADPVFAGAQLIRHQMLLRSPNPIPPSAVKINRHPCTPIDPPPRKKSCAGARRAAHTVAQAGRLPEGSCPAGERRGGGAKFSVLTETTPQGWHRRVKYCFVTRRMILKAPPVGATALAAPKAVRRFFTGFILIPCTP